jgi:hypothetical protein
MRGIALAPEATEQFCVERADLAMMIFRRRDSSVSLSSEEMYLRRDRKPTREQGTKEKSKSSRFFALAKVTFRCKIFKPLLNWVPMLSQFSAFPPLSESPLEVSDVRPNSQSFSIDIERRVVLR